MNPSWKTFLSRQGAAFVGDGIADFGDPAAERRAAADTGVICDLSHRALISVAGDDAFAFLQGQLTCDMNEVSAKQSRLGAWCSPKGRVLVVFRAIKTETGFLLELAGSQLEATIARLKMYLLRSRVTLEPVSDRFVRLGLAGEAVAGLISELFSAAPVLPDEVAPAGEGFIIRLRGSPPRFQFFGQPAAAEALWQAAAAKLTPAGGAAWSLLEIQTGVPESVESDQHLPQMINLDLLGGLSFKKGCYVGQEIIARTHHLGRLKRRMYFIASAAGEPPPAGAAVIEAPEGTEAGRIVSSAPRADADGFAALAVLRIDTAKRSTLRLDSARGTELQVKELPYAVARERG